MPKEYPRGKIRQDDDGQVSVALAIQDHTLILAFPYPVSWLGLGIADAEALIAGMQAKVDEMKKAVS